jgi:peptide/nickel transport system permease protein
MTTLAAEQLAPPVARRSRGLAVFMSNRAAVIGGCVVAAFVIAALLAPAIAPYDPLKTNFLAIRKPPSALFLLGTDELGRDILSRLLWGARASLMAGCVSVAIAMSLGVPFGLIAGYFGGLVDAVISRMTEALLSCPFLVLAIALGAFLGPSLGNAMIAIGLSAMPIFVRLTRGQVLAVRAEDYIEGARAVGLPDRWIILRYVLPNVLSPIVVQATLAIATAIIADKNYLEQAPWMSLSPGTAIFLTVLGFNLLGDGLRDALDPREL